MKLVTLPGLIDPHVHLRDPGQTEKEDFYTGTCAALAGGFTTVADMPNNKTPIFSLMDLEEKIKIAKQKTVCNLGFYFGSDGKSLEEFKKVKGMVLGLKVYMNETTGNFLIDWKDLENIFKSWPGENGPILLHAEEDAIDFAIKIVEKTKKKTHICHISLASELESIVRAKNRGLPITCGVTPHHLFLTRADEKLLGPFGTMKPSLKSQNNVDYLWKNIDQIDVIESDHAPHTKQQKKSGEARHGVSGLETTLPLLLTAVNEGKIKIDDIKRLCFTNPKKILSAIHAHWTFHNKVVVDLDEEWIIENDKLKTKCGWSPFSERKVKGKVKEVYLHRKLVFKNEKVLAKPGSGKIITS